MSYSPPSSAKPFTLNVPDKDLSEWRQLLQLSKIGPTTYENTQTEHHYGVTKKWLSETKDYWLNKYDWRAQEKHINSFDNFRMLIDGIDVHFIGHFSDKKDAVPIVFMHGWPGSFIEFIPMLELIRDKWSKKDLPYHIIIPSLPGYTLSAETQPTDKDWTMEDSADIIDKLMTNLGFAKYLAQGGDVGSFVARILAQSKDACVGIHLNMFTTQDQPDPNTLSATQKAALARAGTWLESGRGYAIEHGTRPSTIGHVLSSNPLALLAWIGEKFLEWSDEPPALDHILTNISLYWFTAGFPRSIYPYRVLFGPTRPNIQQVTKPTGASYFHHEIIPVFKSVVEKNANLVVYAEHERGGHFAALERPVEFWGDVREFVDVVWKV